MPHTVNDHRFPPDFVWGTATSAFQIEGAGGGRGRSIWDTFCETPGAITDGSDATVACDHYHQLERDLDLMVALGMPAYRFSIAWPRVQPDGRGDWNADGLAFYDRLLDGLERRYIAAHLTLHHWDLPQALQDAGGWAARETAACFADYAAAMARRYGHRVASISTLNEPWVMAVLGHESGVFAPGIRCRRTAARAAHHLLLAHGLALRALRALRLPAALGIVLNLAPIQPLSDAPGDAACARLEDGKLVRWYMDALLRGAYPDDVLDWLGDDAPPVRAGDMALVATPLDFLGVNYYTRVFAGDSGAPPPEPPLGRTTMGWEVWPQGLTDLLLRLHRDYALPPLYIMENGAACADVPAGGRVADPLRIAYLRTHIEALAVAMAAGVDVRGYFAWSLLDNFEWTMGYTQRFGLVYVDYASGRRIPKDSALWYRDFIARQLRGWLPEAAPARLPNGR